MTFDWSQYLNLAKELDGQSTVPADREAKRRTTISRAYYAAFISARNYLQEREGVSIPATGDAHKYVSDKFRGSADKVRQDIKEILERLRKARNKADYNNNVPELLKISKIAIRRSQQVLSKLNSLGSI